MHANRLMPNVYRKKLLAFTIIGEKRAGAAPHDAFQSRLHARKCEECQRNTSGKIIK